MSTEMANEPEQLALGIGPDDDARRMVVAQKLAELLGEVYLEEDGGGD